MRNAQVCRILVGELKGKKTLGRRRRRWRESHKMDYKI
jgi:hypothetical protein